MEQSQTNLRWRYNYGTLWLIIIGFFSFFIAAYILLVWNNPMEHAFPGNKSGFHEIRYDPAEIIDAILMAPGADSSVIKRLNNVRVMPDTVRRDYFNKQFRFGLEPNEFSRTELDSTQKQLKQPISFTIYDTAFKAKAAYGKIYPKVRPFVNDVTFFSKYPGFGVWILLIIIQLSVAAMIIAAAIFFLFRDYPLAGHETQTGYKPGVTILYLIAGIALMFILYIGFFSGGANPVLKPDYFFLWLKGVFRVVNPWVYLASALCFAGFLSCVSQGNFAKDQLDKATLPEEKQKYLGLIKSINQRFDQFFVALGLMLSLAVFTSGTLFSALNGMDFIKQVSKALGYSPFSYDAVYLYGIIHSFLLLVLYLPCRFVLNQVNRSAAKHITTDNASGEKGKDMQKLLPPLKKFTEIIVASSPLLASLLQYLVDILFN